MKYKIYILLATKNALNFTCDNLRFHTPTKRYFFEGVDGDNDKACIVMADQIAYMTIGSKPE